MGLDMYLRGEKFFWTNFKEPEKQRKENGFEVDTLTVELGYWRKHPNLHGYIVATFAEGKDECQQIDLSKENIMQIMQAIRDRALPTTTGFFFGTSSLANEQAEEDLKTFQTALEWESVKEEGLVRSVYYRASW